VHRDRGRKDLPISDEEIAFLDREFGGDDMYRVDVEGWRLDAFLARGFGPVTVSARIPWIAIGSPRWDSAAEEFHSVIPVSESYERDIFARGQTLVFIRGDDAAITARSELERSGLGDIALTATMPLLTTARGSHAAAVSVSPPTGKRGTLHGSGGWDSGVRWFSSWSGGRRHYALAAGYNHPGGGDLLGIDRTGTWNVYAAVEQPLGRRWSATIRGRADSSPLASVTGDDIGRPAFFYRLGIMRRAGPDHILAIELGEELAPQWGIDADFSLHVGVVRKFRD
jgi:hypothetical protein